MSIGQPTAGAPTTQATQATQAAPPLAGAAGSPDSGAKESAAAEVRLTGRLLVFARLGWVVVALLSVALLLGVSLNAYTRIFTLAFLTDPVRRDVVRDGLAQLGLSAEQYAAYVVGLAAVRTLIFFALGAVIFAKRSDSLVAILVSLFLMTYSVSNLGAGVSMDLGLALTQALISTIAYSSLILLFIFPDGHFVPRWTRYPAAIWVAFMALVLLPFPHWPTTTSSWGLYFNLLAAPAIVGMGVFAQIYRYRHFSGPIERQQIKWTVFASAVLIAVTAATAVVAALDPTLDLGYRPGYRGVVFALLSDTLFALAVLCIPFSLVIAILRYRLWDIDLIINRTLVYVPLTGIVAGLYAGTVALFQKIFLALTGQQSDAAIVLTTLIVAALFTPIKNGLQSLVDRRFKEAPDPARKLRAFGERLESVIEVFDAERVTSRALEEAVRAFDAAGGAIYVHQHQDQQPAIAHTLGEWNANDARATVPIACDGDDGNPAGIGTIQLGPRKDGSAYTAHDLEILENNATILARAIMLARRV